MRKLHGFLLLLIVLLVSGCGSSSSSIKNEAQMAADILENKFYLEEYSRFTIEDLSVSKRQTDKANKTDKVFVTVDVINGNETLDGYKENTIQGNIDLILTYGLYNDGWILDSCEIDEDGQYGAGSFQVQEGLNLTEGQLLNILADYGYGVDSITVEDHQFDPEEQTETYSIHATKEYTYVTEERDVYVESTFIGDKNAGYYGSLGTWYSWINGDFVGERNWNISGTYRYGDTDTTVYIPYAEPVDNMTLEDIKEEFGKVVNTWDISLDYIAAFSKEDYISIGYSARLWDGQDMNYNKLHYYDFDYFVVGHRNIILFGPNHIARISISNGGTVDTVGHVVYVKIDELIPID